MIKTLAQVVYSELKLDDYYAIEAFCGDNGINYEFSVGDATWIRILNPTDNALASLETSVFGQEIKV